MEKFQTVLHSVGGWGQAVFWEKKKGKDREQGIGLRALGIGQRSFGPRIYDWFHYPRWEEIICKWDVDFGWRLTVGVRGFPTVDSDQFARLRFVVSQVRESGPGAPSLGPCCLGHPRHPAL